MFYTCSHTVGIFITLISMYTDKKDFLFAWTLRVDIIEATISRLRMSTRVSFECNKKKTPKKRHGIFSL